MLLSIPSPGSDSLSIFGLELRFYGLMIALGVLAGVEITRRRQAARGGDPDDWSSIAMWAVPAGLIGARLYHVITDWRRFEDDWLQVFNIRAGGLGIPGGVLLGTLVGLYVAKRKGLRLPIALDIAAPAIPIAQAIGRLGNWFNQELFGEPTTVPWALEIDPEHRPVGYLDYETFHPTFAYEALWNLALVGVLIWIDKRRVLRPGYLLAVYVAGYSMGRLWVELLRIDPASLILGIRVNVWMSVIAFVVSVVVLVLFGRRRPGDGTEESAAADDTDDSDGGERDAGDGGEDDVEGTTSDAMASEPDGEPEATATQSEPGA